MVLYFSSDAVSPKAVIYMGEDKHRNEELIKWGWPEDVWFHVDDLSSAHVYLRLPEGLCFESIPEALLNDCAQLVKANSIKGNKMNNVQVVYTPWSNLKKKGDMDVGQVGFKDKNLLRYVTVEKRDNAIVNRLNKTKLVKTDVDLRHEREERDRKERAEIKKRKEAMKKELEAEQRRKEEENRLRHYEDLFTPENMRPPNRDGGSDSDDFM
uniref:Coiled-coil domain-containing protein 25 n=1 Tax=Trichuris muris TaxID=70415 RepID=A0A5S6QLY7_TRIMR